MTRAPDAYSEARIEEIREAAVRVFARKGIEHARMQDIADEAGLSAGALYRYFAGKDDLTRRVLEACEAENRQHFEEARAAAGSPLGALLATGRTAWSWFEDEDVRQQLILGLEVTLASARDVTGVDGQLGHHLFEVIARLETLVREAQAGGELSADIDPRALATLLLAAHQGLGVLLLGQPVTQGNDAALDTGAVLELLVTILQASASNGEA